MTKKTKNPKPILTEEGAQILKEAVIMARYSEKRPFYIS